MKLRNKKTGEIVNAMEADLYTDVVYLKISKDGRYDSREYDSFAEFNEDWEDYEEPKDIWWLDNEGNVNHACLKEADYFEKNTLIGNYFKTKEEAEKAVERLKAWKRLKDKGFRFVGRSIKDLTITYSFDNYDEPDIPQMNKDLDLLFGGEDE